MSTASLPSRPALPSRTVLADLLPRTMVRDVVVVVAAVVLTAVCAQLVVPLPFTPVPLTGQTFAVLLTAAALGPLRGAIAQGLYVAVGLAGLPVYQDGGSGLTHLTGATGGYLVAYVVVGMVVGACARRGLDRSALGTAAMYLLGSAIIYAIGVPWLAVVAGYGPGEALAAGMVPFLIGDAVKALIAAGLLPTAWRLANR